MLAVKPAELRNNQKEYFDQAYKGETILVSRPKNCNVVIISEQQFNEMQQLLRSASYYSKLTEAKQKSLVDVVREAEELEERRMKRRAFDKKVQSRPVSDRDKKQMEKYLKEMRDDRF